MLRLTLFGGFSLVSGAGSELAVKSQKARALLAILARPAGKSRSREEIISLLWSDRGEAQARASLRQVLSGLRKELNAEAADALQISDEAISLDPAHVIVEAGEDEFLAGFHLHDPAFEDWLRDERLRIENSAEHAGPSNEADRTGNVSIAVLPFANLSGDSERDYFAEGLTEDVNHELNKFQSLDVIARGTSAMVSPETIDVVEIGERLGAQFIMQGSVRRGGDRIRISAQLIESGAGNLLWSERYDRRLADIFSVQDDVASSIASMVKGHVEIARTPRAQQKHSETINAQDLLRRADWLLYREYASDEAFQLLEQVLNIDPELPEAHAKLAIFHAYKLFSDALTPEDVSDAVKQYGTAAAKLAPGDAMVHAPVAEAYVLIGEFDLARHHVERALDINPNGFLVMGHTAEALALLGNHQAGLELIEKAVQNDPYSSISFRENLFDILYLAGDYEGAVEQMIGWPDPPLHLALAHAAVLGQLGRIEEAQAVLEQFEAERPEGWNTANVLRSYCGMCARPEDRERWREGFRKAGLEI